MPERQDHDRNVIANVRINPCAKSFILCVYDVLARYRANAMPHELAELRDPQVRASEEQIAQLGSPIAIKAMAAKLARLVYRMLRYGMKYVDQGAQF